ncbi:MAG: hypothetical protein CMH83_02655 [Nocardioides sp.]|nr:hypothetical protein [Nocardioides sp.]
MHDHDPAPTAPPGDDRGTTYRERLHVPLRWWVQGTMLVASLWLALVVSVPGTIAWTATGVALALLVAVLRGYGGTRVEVADGWLRAGSAQVEAAYVGGVTALDAEETRRVAGVEADARAFLLLRPYLKRAVRVRLDDPADPTPYWLISSRRPEALAAALSGLDDTSPGRTSNRTDQDG